MTWSTLTSDDVLSNEYAEGDHAQGLHDRDTGCKERAFTLLVEGSSTATAWAQVDTIKLRIPSWVEVGDELHVGLRLRATDATDTAYMRIVDSGGTNGASDSVTGTDFSVAESVLTVPTGTSWADTTRTIELEVQADSGTQAEASSDWVFLNAYWETP